MYDTTGLMCFGILRTTFNTYLSQAVVLCRYLSEEEVNVMPIVYSV